VEITVNDPVNTAGTYHGLALVKQTGAANFEPLAWIVVQAD